MADVWLFDSVTQFLKGANWAVPVWDFIDDNCIVFDSEEENKLEGLNEVDALAAQLELIGVKKPQNYATKFVDEELDTIDEIRDFIAEKSASDFVVFLEGPKIGMKAASAEKSGSASRQPVVGKKMAKNPSRCRSDDKL